MKKTIAFLFIILYSHIFAQSKFEGKIIYVKSIKKTETIKEKLKTDPLYKMLINTCKNIKYELIIKQNRASFSVIKELNSDNNRQLEFVTKIGGGAVYYYYNLIDKIIFHQQEFYDTNVIIKRGFGDFKWELKNETKQIGNYLCYKATTSIKRYKLGGIYIQNIEAWYCPQWSLNIGPVGYAGLPGLIMELTDLGNGVSYQISSVSQHSNFNIPKKPTKGKVITLKEYDEMNIDNMYNYKK